MVLTSFITTLELGESYDEDDSHHKLRSCLKSLMSTIPTLRNIVDRARGLRQVLLFVEG